MAYTVLARKYRSEGFDEVVGQGPICETLKNAIKSDRVAHAYLFTGTRGVGKTTMARILAKSLNCLKSKSPTTEPCCKCESCVAISTGDDIDVIEIDGASNNGVDEVRKLRENAIYRPARARFKIYIIDEVHMLSPGAFNALLKILEEPPDHVKFIFATTEPNKVIATIQSRCQRFDFNNIGTALIAEHLGAILKQEKIAYDEDMVLPLAKLANGSMRDGLTLLDRLISTGEKKLTVKLLEEFVGCPSSEKIYNLVSKVADSDAAGTLLALNELVSSGQNEVQVVDYLIGYMRDLMVVKSTGAESELLALSAEQKKQVSELSEKFDIAALVYNITSLEKLRWTIKNSETGRALLEAALLRFALSEHFINVEYLAEQLKSGGSPELKKKLINTPSSSQKTVAIKTQVKEKSESQSGLFSSKNSEGIISKWPEILSNLGKGTAGLLTSAEPKGIENGILIIEFGTAAAKEMFERGERVKEVETLLAEKYGCDLKIKLETAAKPEEAKSEPTASQKQEEIAGDELIKDVLTGFDATIIGYGDLK